MLPVGTLSRATPAVRRSDEDDAATPDAVAGLQEAGEGMIEALAQLEAVLDEAPRDAAVPLVCLVASAHALYTRMVLVGTSDAPVEARPGSPCVHARACIRVPHGPGCV